MIRKDAMTKLKRIEKEISQDEFHRISKEVKNGVHFYVIGHSTIVNSGALVHRLILLQRGL